MGCHVQIRGGVCLRRIKLLEVAFARSGDKGDTSNIGVVPYRDADYEWLRRVLTPERVKAHFAGLVRGEVIRYELPGIRAFNFVMKEALDGGVSRSLNLDVHGKNYGNILLELELEVDEP